MKLLAKGALGSNTGLNWLSKSAIVLTEEGSDYDGEMTAGGHGALSKLSKLQSVAVRTAPDVFHARSWGMTWGEEVISELKNVARTSARARARLCLHPSPHDSHQEMLIVMAQSACETPQRRTIGFDTKIIMEGTATLRYFSDQGDLIRSTDLGGHGALYVHTSGPEFHSLSIRSPWFVFMEILQGPFDSATTEFAPWAKGDFEA